MATAKTKPHPIGATIDAACLRMRGAYYYAYGEGYRRGKLDGRLSASKSPKHLKCLKHIESIGTDTPNNEKEQDNGEDTDEK